MLQLRDYQEDIIERTRQSLRTHKNTLIRSECGSGKTALSVFMMGSAAKLGKRSIFIVHQAELLEQTSRALWLQHLEHAVIAPGKRKSKMPVQVAMVQTLAKRLDQYPEPDLIFIDECHRSAANQYQKVLEHWPNARVIGLTATPQRTDGKGLDHIYSDIVPGPSMTDLVARGYLASYDLIAPPIQDIDVSSVKTRMGDYDKKQLEAEMDKPTITGDAVRCYKQHTPGQRCVVMCVSVKHAEHVRDQYVAAGIPAACIEGSMKKGERNRVVEQFRSGEIKVLTNVELMVVGVDIPAIEVVQWLRPTQSLIIWVQGCGRGMRPAPGKSKVTIIDHVQNWTRHGLPDEDREWSLEGRKKGKRKKADDDPDVNVQQCVECFHVFVPGPDSCPSCGALLPKKPRPELEVVDGELEKIDVEAVRRERKREQGQARTLEDLVALGLRRGLKKPAEWAAITMSARRGKKPTGADFKQARDLMTAMQNPTEGGPDKGVF